MTDHPFDEVAAEARAQIATGHWVCQKFTCRGCGNRLTISVPNVFHTHGSCDKCGTITDIRTKGCNYLLMKAGRSPLEKLVEIGAVASLPPNPGLTIAETSPGDGEDGYWR